MSSSKKIDLQRDFPAGLYLSECINFVGSESGQIQSDKLLQNMNQREGKRSAPGAKAWSKIPT